MKEFCGYKSLDGSLHETQQSCQRADHQYKVYKIKEKFNKIEDFIRGQLKESYRYSTGNDYVNNYIIESMMIYIFANKRQELLDIYKQGDLMKKELDDLKKEYDKSQHNCKWWLKVKWWK